jgi:hypothetical protein
VLAFGLGRLFAWRQVAAPLALYAALALILFSVSNLMLESKPFADRYPFVSTPVRLLFFLFFCLYPDGRFVLRDPRRSLRAFIVLIYSMFALALPQALVTLNGASVIPAANSKQGSSTPLPDALGIIFLALILVRRVLAYRDLTVVGVRFRARWLRRRMRMCNATRWAKACWRCCKRRSPRAPPHCCRASISWRPCRWQHGQMAELHARGMPLGLMPGSCYEEHETVLQPGATVLLITHQDHHSDVVR